MSYVSCKALLTGYIARVHNSKCSVRLAVRTTPFHGVNRGSIPLRSTKEQK